MNSTNTLPKNLILPLTAMRLLIGWHFLYEGILKLYNPAWSAKPYLISAETMTGFYQWLASDSMIGIVDTLNVAILLVVGLSLLLGFRERAGAVTGILILVLYYFAHPAFFNSAQLGAEGNYLLVNKNLIEAAALWVLYSVPTGSYYGLEVFFKSSATFKTS